jgi:CheY-like chemotaxis protein
MVPNPLVHAAVPKLVLLAEPSIDTFGLYKTYLVPRRYVVEHALTGPEALAKALADPPDVVIIERQLPIIDGFALCALLRNDPRPSDYQS